MKHHFVAIVLGVCSLLSVGAVVASGVGPLRAAHSADGGVIWGSNTYSGIIWGS